MKKIYTIGHSTKPISDFIQKLEENKIEILIDIRTIPRSRFQPQYNENALRESMTKQGIEYRSKGKSLGGRGENVGYEEAIDELVSLVESGKKVSVLCSEGDYKKCHRHEMLEPSFIEKGLEVEHILYEKKA